MAYEFKHLTDIVGMKFGLILTTEPPRTIVISAVHSIAPRPIRTVNCGAAVILYIVVGEWKNTRIASWIVASRIRTI